MPPKRKRVKLQDRVLTFRVPVRTLVKLATRLVLLGILIVAFVFFVRGMRVRALTASVVGVKFLEVLTDVVADRLFPQIGEDL